MAFVQPATPVVDITTDTTTEISLPTMTEGNDVLVVVSVASPSVNVTGVTDALLNTYLPIASRVHSGASCQIHLFKARITTGSASPVTITVAHDSTSNRREVFAYEWSELWEGAADQTDTEEDADDTTTHLVGPTGTLVQADEMVLAAYSANGSATDWTPDSGWTERTHAASPRAYVQDKVVSSTAGVQATAVSTATNVQAAMLIATFRVGEISYDLTAHVSEYSD